MTSTQTTGTREPTVFFLTPDYPRPSGGIRRIYHYVETLSAAGIRSRVVHHAEGFRCTWFDNKASVAYIEHIEVSAKDIVVVPEVWLPYVSALPRGLACVILNLNPFRGVDVDSAYECDDVLAAITVSELARAYLRFAFPQLRVERVSHGIDVSVFNSAGVEKRRRIAYMPRRHHQHISTVIDILRRRGLLSGWELTPIEGRTERETARILQGSLLFFSGSQLEGFGRPPLEAMACGCVVVGYPGLGGREYFSTNHSFPIPDDDVLAFAMTAETVLRMDSSKLEHLGRLASSFVINKYSLDAERGRLVSLFEEFLDRLADRSGGPWRLPLAYGAHSNWRLAAHHGREAIRALFGHRVEGYRAWRSS